jgi:uncharacterized RDD family membrane protein YckC
MNIPPPLISPPVLPTLPPAPVSRRFGALLLDSAAGLLLVYSGNQLVDFAYSNTPALFVVACVTAFQFTILGWTLCKDSWWQGQGLGKRLGAVLVADFRTNQPANRFRCIWRQTIFIFIVFALYLPAYLYVVPSPDMISSAVASSLVTVAAPLRLVAFLLPDQTKAAGDMVFAQFLVLGFMLLEALMVMSRRDGRRIVDLLAGTQVVDAKSSADN